MTKSTIHSSHAALQSKSQKSSTFWSRCHLANSCFCRCTIAGHPPFPSFLLQSIGSPLSTWLFQHNSRSCLRFFPLFFHSIGRSLILNQSQLTLCRLTSGRSSFFFWFLLFSCNRSSLCRVISFCDAPSCYDRCFLHLTTASQWLLVGLNNKPKHKQRIWNVAVRMMRAKNRSCCRSISNRVVSFVIHEILELAIFYTSFFRLRKLLYATHIHTNAHTRTHT